MPMIGLGTMMLKDKDFIVKAVVDGEYRHIDTAQCYENENIVGEALKEIEEQGVAREDIFLTTKIWTSDFSDPVGSLQKSLKRLDQKYVDLVLVHWPINDLTEDGKSFKRIPMYKIWAGFEECVDLGLTKNIGISNFNCQLICDMLTYCNIKPACNQIELHPYCQQQDLVKFCQNNDICVVGYSPLSNPSRPFGGGGPKTVLEEKVIIDIAFEHECTPAQICLAWNLQRDVGLIPKTSSLERAKENLNSQEITLSEMEIKSINKLDKNERVFDPIDWSDMLNVPIFK